MDFSTQRNVAADHKLCHMRYASNNNLWNLRNDSLASGSSRPAILCAFFNNQKEKTSVTTTAAAKWYKQILFTWIYELINFSVKSFLLKSSSMPFGVCHMFIWGIFSLFCRIMCIQIFHKPKEEKNTPWLCHFLVCHSSSELHKSGALWGCHKMFYSNFSLFDIKVSGRIFYFINFDIHMMYQIFGCDAAKKTKESRFFSLSLPFVYTESLYSTCRKKIANIECSALFDVKIKLQRWKSNKLSHIVYSTHSSFIKNLAVLMCKHNC